LGGLIELIDRIVKKQKESKISELVVRLELLTLRILRKRLIMEIKVGQ
jgi:hypothetical protein